MTLHYHKCNDCLTAFTTVENHVDECDCGGKITYMGEVQGNKYVRHEDRSPCDGRCTHASGPICDCICSGANHGSGKLVQVTVVKGIVKASGLTEDDIERADKYRMLRDYAEKIYDQRFDSIMQMMHDNVRVTPKDYFACRDARKQLDKAISMRQYDPRTVALIDFIKNYASQQEKA